MRVLLAWFLGLGLGVNGLAMLAVPDAWYAAVPGVSDTGPFNAHFVRDIGAAYLVAGTAFVALALSAKARPAALAAAAFLVLHALVHAWDLTAGREHAHALLAELPTIYLLALLAIWLTWPTGSRRHPSAKENNNDPMVSAPLAR
jgi:hypothetical protein